MKILIQLTLALGFAAPAMAKMRSPVPTYSEFRRMTPYKQAEFVRVMGQFLNALEKHRISVSQFLEQGNASPELQAWYKMLIGLTAEAMEPSVAPNNDPVICDKFTFDNKGTLERDLCVKVEGKDKVCDKSALQIAALCTTKFERYLEGEPAFAGSRTNWKEKIEAIKKEGSATPDGERPPPVSSPSAVAATKSGRLNPNQLAQDLDKFPDERFQEVRCINSGFVIMGGSQAPCVAPKCYRAEKSKTIYSCQKTAGGPPAAPDPALDSATPPTPPDVAKPPRGGAKKPGTKGAGKPRTRAPSSDDECAVSGDEKLVSATEADGRTQVCNPALFGLKGDGTPLCIVPSSDATKQCLALIQGMSEEDKRKALDQAVAFLKDNPSDYQRIVEGFGALCMLDDKNGEMTAENIEKNLLARKDSNSASKRTWAARSAKDIGRTCVSFATQLQDLLEGDKAPPAPADKPAPAAPAAPAAKPPTKAPGPGTSGKK